MSIKQVDISEILPLPDAFMKYGQKLEDQCLMDNVQINFDSKKLLFP